MGPWASLMRPLFYTIALLIRIPNRANPIGAAACSRAPGLVAGSRSGTMAT